MAELKLVTVNHRTAEQFAVQIKGAWAKQVDSIIETGLLLETAQAELDRGEWGKIFKTDKFPFGVRTAQKLMKIAKDERLSDAKFTSYLPAKWDILNELSLLSDDAFDTAIVGGGIHPQMTMKDAKELRGIVPKRKVPDTPRERPPRSIERCAMKLRSMALEVIDELPMEQWDILIVELQAEIKDICTTIAKRKGAV